MELQLFGATLKSQRTAISIINEVHLDLYLKLNSPTVLLLRATLRAVCYNAHQLSVSTKGDSVTLKMEALTLSPGKTSLLLENGFRSFWKSTGRDWYPLQ